MSAVARWGSSSGICREEKSVCARQTAASTDSVKIAGYYTNSHPQRHFDDQLISKLLHASMVCMSGGAKVEARRGTLSSSSARPSRTQAVGARLQASGAGFRVWV